MSKKDVSKWMNLLALFLYVIAVFKIVDGSIQVGAIVFAAATCFVSVANLYMKRLEVEREGSE